mmetsp:Transcript_100686/g.313904  ORF Transcript_100686/g.313904 Transcript_100686/m.313904 type:complete len:101 (+) Transcript_100686:99-401(+)
MFRLALAKAEAAILPVGGRRSAVTALPLPPRFGLALARPEAAGESALRRSVGAAACAVACSALLARRQAVADARMVPEELEATLARELIVSGIYYSPLAV